MLKHFNSKWGSSSIAQGDPMLFPYGRGEHLASNKWTLKENISVGDVYATIGSPPNFRLRSEPDQSLSLRHFATEFNVLTLSCFKVWLVLQYKS